MLFRGQTSASRKRPAKGESAGENDLVKGTTMRTAVLLLTLAATAAHAAHFFVSPAGSDANPGTADRPFATLEAARDAARKTGAGPHRIELLPGDYFLAKPFDLDGRDNGLTVEASSNGVTLYGGKAVGGWRRDGDRFWCADVPGVKEGAWDFRALAVNGHLPDRARLPESGTFTHQSVFDVKWLSSVGGGWERKPTKEELTTLVYSPTNLPATLDVRNAEVRVYHMWDESLVGVASNDVANHTLHFTVAAKSPAGSFGVKKYVVFNTREGLTHPGQWYLDRTAGRVVYWPLPGEDMAKAKVVAPTLERVVRVQGTEKAPAERIALRGFSVQATTTPLKPAGFSASEYDGAVVLMNATDCALANVEICNVGGQAVKAWNLKRCRIAGCDIHDIGACGIRAGGDVCAVVSNRICRVGCYHPSATALSVSHKLSDAATEGFHVYRNEIHDVPYCGMIISGGGHLVEENLLYRVMRELQDGAAIYGGAKKCVLRGNLVRDVVKMGEGYGVSSYYLDEGSADCIVEHNVSLGVERPVHNHISSDLIIRDNVFVAETNMSLSFPRSRRCVFTGNTLFAPGKVTLSPPNAVTAWSNNVVFHQGLDKGGTPQPFSITDAAPAADAPGRRSWPFTATQTPQAPAIDGEIGADEWTAPSTGVDREPSRWGASGAPAFARFAYDDTNLYVAVNTVLFDIGKLSKGGAWGKDDGMEIDIAGDKGTYVLHGFADGTCASVADAGAPADAVAALGSAVRFAAKPYGKTKGDWKSGWRCEWAIPFAALGIKPEPGKKVAFNLGLYRAEDGVWRCLEGTCAENWRLDQAATLQFK